MGACNSSQDETKILDQMWQIAPDAPQCTDPDSLVLRETISIEEFYTIGAKLGAGGYGEVREAEDKNGTLYAVKVIDKNNTNVVFEHLRTEVLVLAKTKNCEHIVNLHKVYEDEAFLYLVMEHCAGGELYLLERGLGEKYTKQIAIQMFTALKYLHKLGITHGDLKVENFLFKCGQIGGVANHEIKMIDFGMSKFRDSEPDSNLLRIGTERLMAPEVLEGTSKKEPSDLWSMGALIFEMIIGTHLFFARNGNSLEHYIKEGFTPIVHRGWGSYFPKDYELTHDCMDFITKLLVKDPNKRMTAKTALEHPWLKSHNKADKTSEFTRRRLTRSELHC